MEKHDNSNKTKTGTDSKREISSVSWLQGGIEEVLAVFPIPRFPFLVYLLCQLDTVKFLIEHPQACAPLHRILNPFHNKFFQIQPQEPINFADLS